MQRRHVLFRVMVLLLLFSVGLPVHGTADTADIQWYDQDNSVLRLGDSERLIHFSVDDVSVELQDLAENEASYRSIWTSPYFSLLRRAHNAGGCCITLNCFTDYNGFHITSLPINSVWQKELQEASGWLRFAFHAKENRKYRNGQSMLADYNDFVHGILRLTGSLQCIDRITRLGFFTASEENLLELADAVPGCVGFLCADTQGFVSYCLTEDEALEVWQQGYIYDERRGIVFIKSLPRMDSGRSANDIIKIIQSDFHATDHFVEIFFHSPVREIKTTAFSHIAKWAASHGYRNSFPMDEIIHDTNSAGDQAQ